METLQLVIPILWTLVLIFSVLYVSTNKKFPVTTFADYVRIDASPALAWSKKKKGGVIVGIALLVLMWIMFFVVSADLHLEMLGSERSNAGSWMIFIPLVGSVIAFFSNYSSGLANNYVSVPKGDFNNWIANGYIEERGQGNYVDVEGDKLLHAFDSKKWIR